MHHIKFLKGLAATGKTVGEGWFLAGFPTGIHQLMLTLMLVLHPGAMDQDQEQMKYTFLMHYSGLHTLRETQNEGRGAKADKLGSQLCSDKQAVG